MTAEEVALRRFRAAVEFARFHRKESASAARLGNAVEQYAHWRLSSAARDTASDIANIIRAIRAERTPFHAMEKRLAGSIEGGIEAGIALIKARAYAQGRRDALREAIDLCRRTEAGDTNHDWREAAKCCRELIESLAAEAAEEEAGND